MVQFLKKLVYRLSSSFLVLTGKAYSFPCSSYQYMFPSFSQEGEDLLLRRIFYDQRQGFYVDIGAHHPQRFSNTHLLYMKGWNGINIDANPASISVFKKTRKRDININVGVSDKSGYLNYYLFSEPAYNTFSKEIAESRNQSVISEKLIPVKTLDEILGESLTENQEIDLMTIDVEGLELNIILSNNWELYRPKVLVVEILDMDSIDQVMKSSLYLLLREHGYILYSKLMNSVLFVDSSCFPLFN